MAPCVLCKILNQFVRFYPKNFGDVNGNAFTYPEWGLTEKAKGQAKHVSFAGHRVSASTRPSKEAATGPVGAQSLKLPEAGVLAC